MLFRSLTNAAQSFSKSFSKVGMCTRYRSTCLMPIYNTQRRPNVSTPGPPCYDNIRSRGNSGSGIESKTLTLSKLLRIASSMGDRPDHFVVMKNSLRERPQSRRARPTYGSVPYATWNIRNA